MSCLALHAKYNPVTFIIDRNIRRSGGWRRHEDDDTCHLRLLAEYEGDVSAPELAGDRHPQDESDERVHLLPPAPPAEPAQVWQPDTVQHQANVVLVVTTQGPDDPRQICLHEHPRRRGVGPEPESEGKCEM